MNKKGFTLIEIIVCLVLIIGIGTISTVTLIKKDNKKLDDLTKKIIDATNIYINVEKDENGNYYSYGIESGAKGVYVSVNTLEEKGYISSDIVKTLEDKTGKNNNYIFVSKSIKNSTDEVCNNTLPQSYNVSWNGTETIYLCPYGNDVGDGDDGGDGDILLVKKYKDNSALFNTLISQKYSTSCHKKANGNLEFSYGTHSDGFCFALGEDVTENEQPVWYYEGDVDNNYLIIDGLKNSNGTDKLFKIVRTVENRSVKIIDSGNFTEQCNSNDDDNTNDCLYKTNFRQGPSLEYNKLYYSYNAYWDIVHYGYKPDDIDNLFLYLFEQLNKLPKSNEYTFIAFNGTVGYDTKDGTIITFDDFFTINSIRTYLCKSYNNCLTVNIGEQRISWEKENVDITFNFSGTEVEEYVDGEDHTITIKSPIFQEIYSPLKLKYNNIKNKIENYIDMHYKWCTKESDKFKCDNDEEKIESPFGLLSKGEYSMIVKHNFIGSSKINRLYGFPLAIGLDQEAELTIDFKNTNKEQESTGIGSQFLRPAYVIKGNSKVISGDGTKDNPYVISGLTN